MDIVKSIQGDYFKMKTKEELQELKEKYEALTVKLKELNEDELNMVTGGFIPPLPRADLTKKDRELIKDNTETVLR